VLYHCTCKLRRLRGIFISISRTSWGRHFGNKKATVVKSVPTTRNGPLRTNRGVGKGSERQKSNPSEATATGTQERARSKYTKLDSSRQKPSREREPGSSARTQYISHYRQCHFISDRCNRHPKRNSRREKGSGGGGGKKRRQNLSKRTANEK